MRRHLAGALILLSLLLTGVADAAAAGSAEGLEVVEDEAKPTTIIATLEQGLNVLHSDFRFARPLNDGQPQLPPGLPPVEDIVLPAGGSFMQQQAAARAGELGHLEPGVLYHVRDTRLLLYVPADQAPTDVFANPQHGTGVASAAIGLRHGTNPEAFLVVVVTDQPGPPAWKWLVDATWIDVVSTSYNNIYASPIPVVSCPEGAAIEDITGQGRVVFSAVGNGEQLGEVMSPSGHPAAYQVGGVDDTGRTWTPSTSYRSVPNHPYETGDRYEFRAADAGSLDGESLFGGTSGATPSTAGRATTLIAAARSILGSTFTGAADGALAVGDPAAAPDSGPLSDGRFDGTELTALLHHTAVPAEPPSPARYLIEGFGALTATSVETARAVLNGQAALDPREGEQQVHELIEGQRRLLFPDGRCPRAGTTVR